MGCSQLVLDMLRQFVLLNLRSDCENLVKQVRKLTLSGLKNKDDKIWIVNIKCQQKFEHLVHIDDVLTIVGD